MTISLEHVVKNCKVVLEIINEVKDIDSRNEQSLEVDSLVAFLIYREPFFAIGRVIEKGLAEDLKFDIDGNIVNIGDTFLTVKK